MTDFAAFGEILLQIITLTFMLIGLFGLIIPIFPGLTIMWVAAAVYLAIQGMAGLLDGWDWFLFVLITLLMLGGNVVDNIIMTKKMRDVEIPWRSIGLGMLAGFIASLFFTPLAGLVATPLALFGAEYLRLRDRKLAFESSRVWMIGFGWAFVARFSIGVVMIVVWLALAWL